MASNLQLGNAGASTSMNALAGLFSSGRIAIFASTQPANANTNTSSANYLLAQCSLSTVVFPSATSNTIIATSTAITATTAVSTGIAEFYRIHSSTGVVIIDGSVSTAAADMNFNSNNFVAGVSVAITQYNLTLPLA
jgi:hypothetical protein